MQDSDITERKHSEEALKAASHALSIYARLVDSAPDLMLVIDCEEVLRFANASYLQHQGMTLDAVVGRSARQLLWGDLYERVVQPRLAQALNGEAVQFEDWFTYSTVGRRFMEVRYVPLQHDGQVEFIGVILRDITERKKVEKILAKERKFLSAILDTTTTLNLVLDPKGAIIRYNAACERLTGISSDHVKGRPIWDLFAVTQDISILRLAIATVKDMPFLNGYETSFRAVDGSERTVAWTNSIFCEERGTDYCIISSGIDITDRKAIERELIKAASIDKLTALINRQELDVVISRERERAIRYSRPLSLIMFDIDHFKRINDTYGHLVGDSVLREVAALAQANLRTAESLGRWGGEEFMLVLPETSIEGACLAAEKLRCFVEGHNFAGIKGLTASFGVTEYYNRENIDKFIQRVDDALYAAKQEGRNRVVCKSTPHVDEGICGL